MTDKFTALFIGLVIAPGLFTIHLYGAFTENWWCLIGPLLVAVLIHVVFPLSRFERALEERDSD